MIGEMSRMCVVCRSIRPDKFRACAHNEQTCKALLAYTACIAAERVANEARASAERCKVHNTEQ